MFQNNKINIKLYLIKVKKNTIYYFLSSGESTKKFINFGMTTSRGLFLAVSNSKYSSITSRTPNAP